MRLADWQQNTSALVFVRLACDAETFFKSGIPHLKSGMARRYREASLSASKTQSPATHLDSGRYLISAFIIYTERHIVVSATVLLLHRIQLTVATPMCAVRRLQIEALQYDRPTTIVGHLELAVIDFFACTTRVTVFISSVTDGKPCRDPWRGANCMRAYIPGVTRVQRW